MQVLQVLRRWVILQEIGKGHLRPKKRLITSTKINQHQCLKVRKEQLFGGTHRILRKDQDCSEVVPGHRDHLTKARRQRTSSRESERCELQVQAEVRGQVHVRCLFPLRLLLRKLKKWLLL